MEESEEDQFQVKEEVFDPEDSKSILNHKTGPFEQNYMVKQEPKEFNSDSENEYKNDPDFVIPGSPELYTAG